MNIAIIIIISDRVTSNRTFKITDENQQYVIIFTQTVVNANNQIITNICDLTFY